MKIKEKIINLWNDPVWSKVISYIIISILSVITSGVITYYSSPSSPREALSVLEALLSYNLSINLFALLTIIILLLIISIIVICKNIFLNMTYSFLLQCLDLIKKKIIFNLERNV